MATTIQVHDEVKDRLDDVGSKGETYNEIVERLLDAYEDNHD